MNAQELSQAIVGLLVFILAFWLGYGAKTNQTQGYEDSPLVLCWWFGLIIPISSASIFIFRLIFINF